MCKNTKKSGCATSAREPYGSLRRLLSSLSTLLNGRGDPSALPAFLSNRKQYVLFDKKGYLTVEAALFLPVFIIGVLTIAYLIKILALQEAVFHSYTDEARELSAEAFYFSEAPFFEGKLQNRLYSEHPKEIQEVDLKHFSYLGSSVSDRGRISMDLDYKVKIRLPISFYSDIPISERLVFRGFVGGNEDLAPLGFEEMETWAESALVWVFPKAGGRYHDESCLFIVNEAKAILLSNTIRRKYDPCSICKPKEITNGNLIYCFAQSGQVYHRGSCYMVDKYVISIEKEEAIEKGYTPCMKCGGG